MLLIFLKNIILFDIKIIEFHAKLNLLKMNYCHFRSKVCRDKLHSLSQQSPELEFVVIDCEFVATNFTLKQLLLSG